MRGLVQNQLKSQSLNSVSPSAFKQVGGAIFPDSTANMDMAKLSAIVEAFQSVHSPNYGQPIPQTVSIDTVLGTQTLLTLTGNEVARIQSITMVNSGGEPIVAHVKIGAAVIFVGMIDPATTTPLMTQSAGFYLDSLNTLSISVISGSASDLATTALSMRVCQ